MSVDTTDVSGDVDEYKYPIGTINLDPDKFKHYKVVDVLEQMYDESEGSSIVAYRREVTETDKLLKRQWRTSIPYTSEKSSSAPRSTL